MKNLKSEPAMLLISNLLSDDLASDLASDLSSLQLELNAILERKKMLLMSSKSLSKERKKMLIDDFRSRVEALRPKLSYFYAKDLSYLSGRPATCYQTVMNNKTCRDFVALEELENYVITHVVRPRQPKNETKNETKNEI